uniref:Uncharacterized protein n=1 Tax=Tanacetum cinerariifolium TaxID=118510 RepID=A0A699ID79_TANCI|nr:hypothetical protein [Tanacetum cinerariifolium]
MIYVVPNPFFTYRPKKNVEKAKKEKKSKKETNSKMVDTSTKVSNAFDVLSSMADLDNNVGMNSFVPPIQKVVNEKEDQGLKMKNKEEVDKPSTSNDKQVEDKVRDGKRKEKTVWFSTKILDSKGNCEESLLTTTYVYEADEHYDCIASPSTTTDVEDDTDDEDESEDTNVEKDKDDEDESDDG